MFSKVVAHRLAVQAKESYSEETINKKETQVLVSSTEHVTIIAFRGTEADNMKDWFTDIKIGKRLFHNKLAHAGFVQAYKDVRNDIISMLAKQRPNVNIYITGHSLGAALATLCAFDLKKLNYNVIGVYTFGSPRVGGSSFKKKYNKLLGNITYRVVNHEDIVCRLPSLLRWRHVGQMIYFNKNGKRQEQLSYFQRLKNFICTSISNSKELVADHKIEQYIKNLKA